MAFNLTKTQEKRLALLQKKNFEGLFLGSDLILDLIQFPESSVLLGKIKDIADSKSGVETQGTSLLFKYLFDFALNQGETCLLVLPGLSPQSEFIYTQYPVIKAEARQLQPLLQSMQGQLIKVDYLALVSESFKHGVVLDFYAGNPEIHGSDKEICQITTW
jgi:hypothetical protein